MERSGESRQRILQVKSISVKLQCLFVNSENPELEKLMKEQEFSSLVSMYQQTCTLRSFKQ